MTFLAARLMPKRNPRRWLLRGSPPAAAAAELSDELADCAVQRFSEANFSRIGNKNGFLMGIIRRVKIDGPDRNTGGDLDSLPRSVRYKLLDLVDEARPGAPPCPCTASPACSRLTAAGHAVCRSGG